LQKHAGYIILHPLTLPYITLLDISKLDSLKHRQMEAGDKFFYYISQPDSYLHHLLPPPCNKIVALKNYSHPTHQNKTILFLHQPCINELCIIIVSCFYTEYMCVLFLRVYWLHFYVFLVSHCVECVFVYLSKAHSTKLYNKCSIDPL